MGKDPLAALEESKELTRGILAAVSAGVVHVASDGAVITANAEAARLLGLSFDQLTERYTSDFETETILEDGAPCPMENYPVTRALATGEPQSAVTIGIRHPTGEVIWCIFRAIPLKDPITQTTTGAIVTFSDVTDRIRVEHSLRRSEANLKAIVGSAPNIIFTADREGRFTFLNRTASGLATEVDTTSVVGQTIFAWTNEVDHDRVRGLLRRVVEQEETVEYEVEGVVGVDPNTYVTRIGPVVESGSVVGVAGVVSVVTERKRAELERLKLVAQLHEARRLEAMGRLAGGVAHDFNNLLTIIRGSVDLLLARLGDHPLAHRAKEIADASSRAASLTRQLLAFGRQQSLQPCVLEVASIVDNLAPMLVRLLGEHIELVVEHTPNIGRVRVDPIEIERVLVNLVTNAQDAMPSGGKCTIATSAAVLAAGQVEGAEPGPHIVLEVRDQGTGMSPETLAHVFEPFFTTKEIGRGSGLGLATVHGIVKQSGGAIEIDSRPGDGSTFRIFLPEVPRREQTPIGVRPARRFTPQPTDRSQLDITGVVLLIEDDPRVREVTKHVLEEAGYRVLDFDAPEKALALTDEVLFSLDLVLSDVGLPKMSGPVVAARLRERCPRLKILLMSGHVHEALAPLPIGYEFLAKPFDRQSLLTAIRKSIHGS